MEQFDKWWNDLKKHRKRVSHWLPHWQAIVAQLNGTRLPRYLTLCARPMIDVFMMVKEGYLLNDNESGIGSVRFCEIDPEAFAEIQDLVGVDGAGFPVMLEEAVLFVDDAYTSQFPGLEEISIELENEGLSEDLVDRLQLKRTHMRVRKSFPYDLVNLDFCEYYYPTAPNMMRVDGTLRQIFEWQRETGDDGTQVSEFVLAVTCRFDDASPAEAEEHLAQIIDENCRDHAQYKQQVEATRGDIAAWRKRDKEDFFLSGWPKDIGHGAKDMGWEMEIVDYVLYRRVGDSGKPYIITCLVAKFARKDPQPDNVAAALRALEPSGRIEIGEIDRASNEGQQLVANLTEIVALRNERANAVQRSPLPDP